MIFLRYYLPVKTQMGKISCHQLKVIQLVPNIAVCIDFEVWAPLFQLMSLEPRIETILDGSGRLNSRSCECYLTISLKVSVFILICPSFL